MLNFHSVVHGSDILIALDSVLQPQDYRQAQLGEPRHNLVGSPYSSRDISLSRVLLPLELAISLF